MHEKYIQTICYSEVVQKVAPSISTEELNYTSRRGRVKDVLVNTPTFT
jgi:hypothetical protein